MVRSLVGRCALRSCLALLVWVRPGGAGPAAAAPPLHAPPDSARTPLAPVRVPAPPSAADQPAPQPARELPEIDAAIAAAIGRHRLPGAVVAAGGAAGSEWIRAYGARAVEPVREPMTVDTVFDLASLTKPVVTATLLMQLVEAKRVRLDARASDYLPELAAHGKGSLTVRQLLLHGSGLPAVDPLRDYEHGRAHALDAILSLPLTAAPGQTFSYSDLGYIVLGALIERVTGESLAQRARRKLFTPLGMRDTGFLPGPELRPRIAPTERIDPRRARWLSAQARAYGVIRGDVHDPRAFRLGGVAGNAGLFSTARDLARFARMLLRGGELDGARVLRAGTVAQMIEPERIGTALRALGWDVRSPYSKLRGHALSARAFGHGGFTGTSLWIDPAHDFFLVFLSNRVHPDGRGNVIRLVGRLTDLAFARLRGDQARDAATPKAPPPDSDCVSAIVQGGIDVLRSEHFASLRGRRVGVVVNDASRARDGTRTLELLRRQPDLTLVSVFVPEHGLSSAREGPIADARWHGVPVYSLFGKTRRPTPEMLRGIDTLVFDLGDVGTRFYTYASTLRQLLEACAGTPIELVVLDRPDPIDATTVEGPVLEAGLESFVNYFPLPIRHGMTMGELARLLRGELGLSTKLRVVWMRGYVRNMRFAQTGLPWYAPSPNLPTPDAALLYPALGLLEGTNVSVGRGTDWPFSFVGAPFIDGHALARALATEHLAGVTFRAARVVPVRDRYAAVRCDGVRVVVQDPALFRPVRTGLALARVLYRLYPKRWKTRRLSRLIGSRAVVEALRRGDPLTSIEASFRAGLARFLRVRQRYLHYPGARPAPQSALH